MKFLVTVQFSTDVGNSFVKNPSFGEKLQTIFTEQKAESIYFCARNGQRTIVYATDVTDGAKLPASAEPWWFLGASSVDSVPCFTPEQMQKAMPDIQAASKKYG